MICGVGGGVATISHFSAMMSLGEKKRHVCVSFGAAASGELGGTCIPVMEQGSDLVQYFDVY